MNKSKPMLLLAATLCGACASESVRQEPIEWSAEWFQCDSRFDCAAVYDAFCKYTAVNTNYLLVYQDWARQQVERSEELTPCEPVEENKPLAAQCRNKVCRH